MGPQSMAYKIISFRIVFSPLDFQYNSYRTHIQYAQTERRGAWQWQKQYDKNSGTNNGIFIACELAASTVDGFK